MGSATLTKAITKAWRAALLSMTLAVLAGCQTPYQQQTLFSLGGFTDHSIDDQTVHIEFAGNVNTPREKVERFFLYRCAEVTDRAGYRYFMVMPKAAMGSNGAITRVRSNGFDHSMMRKMKTKTTTTFIMLPGVPETRWTEEGTIRMFNDDAVLAAQIVGWDAREVLSAMGPYVQSDGAASIAMPKSWVFVPHGAKRRYADLFPTGPSVLPQAALSPVSPDASAQAAPASVPAQARAETSPPVALPSSPMKAPLPTPDVRRNVAGGSTTLIAAHAEFDANCKPLGGAPDVTVLDPAQHGSVDVKKGNFQPAAPKTANACLGEPVFGTQIYYTPKAGFHGIDRIRYQVVSARANTTRTIEIAVD